MATTVVSCPVVTSLHTASSRIERLLLLSDCYFRLERQVPPSLCGQALRTLGYHLALRRSGFVVACLPSNSESEPIDPHQALCLSFPTNEEGLRNAFDNYGQLVEVNLVMDRIANRSRGMHFFAVPLRKNPKGPLKGCMASS